MKTIKFSHAYKKLRNEKGEVIKTAKLILATKIRIEQFPKSFIEYDTEDGLYVLPDRGDFIIMFFEKKDAYASNIFSTIRPYTENKYQYYLRAVGETFNIVAPPGKGEL